IPLAALAHEDRGVATADRAEIRGIAVLPIQLEAEHIAEIGLACAQAVHGEDRPRAGQLGGMRAVSRELEQRRAPVAPARRNAHGKKDGRESETSHDYASIRRGGGPLGRGSPAEALMRKKRTRTERREKERAIEKLGRSLDRAARALPGGAPDHP